MRATLTISLILAAACWLPSRECRRAAAQDERPATHLDAEFTRAGLFPANGLGTDCPDFAAECGGCEECPDILWMATADSLFLTRRTSGSTVLAENTANATQNLNAASLSFSTQPGWDLSLRRNLNTGDTVEIRFFAVDGMSAATTTATTSAELLRVNAAIPIFTPTGTSMDGSASSQLFNLEWNLIRPRGERVSYLAGFRYLELDERFAFRLPNAVVPFDYGVTSRNRLYGAQLGGELSVWNQGGVFSLKGVGKAGLFLNAAAQDGAFSTGVVTQTSHGDRTTAAFVGEMGVTGNWILRNNLALRAGYRLLWIDGVTTATDQVAASEFVFGQGLNATGDTLFHGAFIGLEYCQ